MLRIAMRSQENPMADLPPEVDQVRDALPPPQQEAFDRLVAIAAGVAPGLEAAIKWRVPTFTVGGNWHHWLFSLAGRKRGLVLTFHKGRLLADPGGVLSGTGNYGRTMTFQVAEEVDNAVIAALIEEAIRHQTEL
jgi:hypothetical protein